MSRFGIATWNLNARNFATWERVAALAPEVDVVLVQEARPPTETWWAPSTMASWPPLEALAEHKTPNRWFPTAVVSLNPAISVEPRPEIPVASHRGTLAVADVWAGTLRLATVASAYGMFETAEGYPSGASELSMARILDDLEALTDDAETRLILGGDFNVWTQGDAYAPYRAVLDRLTAMGLYDCIYAGVGRPRKPLLGCPCGGGEGCTHVRTLRSNRKESPGVPYQNDYLYASENLAPPRLIDCRLIDSDDIWQFSDHCVILAEFDL